MKALIPAFLALVLASLSMPLALSGTLSTARFTSLYIERDDKGARVSVQTVGDTVIYKVTLGNKVLESLTAHPTDDDWFKFIQALNAANVYKWAPTYYYPGQGPTWVIDLEMEDRKFNSAARTNTRSTRTSRRGKPIPPRARAFPFSSSAGRPQSRWQSAPTSSAEMNLLIFPSLSSN